jgi:hypothetical protein
MPRRTKPTTRTRREHHQTWKVGDTFENVSTEVVFDAVEKVGALGPHPQAPRHLPGAYYVATVLGNA